MRRSAFTHVGGELWANWSENCHLLSGGPSGGCSVLMVNVATQIRPTFQQKSGGVLCSLGRRDEPTTGDEFDIDDLGHPHSQPESRNLDVGDKCSRTVPRLFHVDDPPSARRS